MKKLFKRLLSLTLCLLMCASVLPFAFAANDYWGYNSYETFVNPETNELTSHPTTLTKVSAKEYKMVSETEAGTTTITLYETNWGTFNLSKWYLKDKSGNTHTFVGGSTDLEYVYRTSLSASGPMYFTGGNHGNEALISLEFYEAGEEVTEYSLGDVNDDGAIDQYDYILVRRHYFETRILEEGEAARADVNNDGAVDQYDYILIARHYFGTYVIDGETSISGGKKIELDIGESVTVDKLHIIEKTKLLYFPDVNPADSIGDYINKNQTYTEDDVFANVVRKYTVTGPQVRLNVDYEYVKDVYHGVSYTCMFPVAKKYGLYADMYDKDGNFLRTVETVEIGKADYSGPMNSGNKATRAVIYGKNDSQYQFDVHINTYEDSLESQRNSFLTAFWDMNTDSNKLYFSKCDSLSLVKYEKGKTVHTECVWQFIYDPEGREPQLDETPEDSGSPEDNLARGLDYVISVTNDDPGAPEYNTYYGASLTDGVAANNFNASDNSWFAFSAYKPNIVNGVGTVTVDLGSEYEITKLRAHLFNNVAGMGVKPPKSVAAYAVVDGNEIKLCDLTGISSSDGVAYWVSGVTEGIITDTVIFKFTLDGAFMYLNEIEVHGE